MNVKAETPQNKSLINLEEDKKVSRSLKDTVFDLTMNILLDHPPDRLIYAAEYFRRMRESRKTTRVYQITEASPEPSEDSTVSLRVRDRSDSLFMKRKSVFAESYNPATESVSFVKPVYEKTREKLKKLRNATQNIFLFRSLDEEQLDEVLDAMFEVEVPKNKVIIQQGDAGDFFYIIDHGFFNVYIKNEAEPDSEPNMVHRYENEGFFGELALLYNQPRAATVQAVTDGSVWALDRKTFRHLVMNSAYAKRKRYEEFIDTVPLFNNLTSYERLNLADALMLRKFQNGDIIIKRGDKPEGIFFVEVGEVSIRVTTEIGDEREVERIGVGEFFGAAALIKERPYVENIYAIGDVRLAFLDQQAINSFLGSCMDDLRKKTQAYEQHLITIINLESLLKRATSKISFMTPPPGFKSIQF